MSFEGPMQVRHESLKEQSPFQLHVLETIHIQQLQREDNGSPKDNPDCPALYTKDSDTVFV